MGFYTDQSFSFNNDIAHEIMTSLKDKGKLLCYSGCDKTTRYTAIQHGVGFVAPDLVIEYDFDKNLIEEKLHSLSLIHKFQSRALVLVRPSAVAITVLHEFLQQEHDFQIVNIAEMVEDIE